RSASSWPRESYTRKPPRCPGAESRMTWKVARRPSSPRAWASVSAENATLPGTGGGPVDWAKRRREVSAGRRRGARSVPLAPGPFSPLFSSLVEHVLVEQVPGDQAGVMAVDRAVAVDEPWLPGGNARRELRIHDPGRVVGRHHHLRQVQLP